MVQEFRRRACSSLKSISKQAFLSILGPPPERSGEDQQLFSSNPSRAFFEKIPDEQWTITSFNPQKREVCVEIQNQSGTRNITVGLSDLSFS